MQGEVTSAPASNRAVTLGDLVHLSDVRVARGGFALRVPQWRIRPGSVVGLVGVNGAGKSTLMELLPGLRAADTGSVEVLGLDPRSAPGTVRSQLGYMTADMPVFDMRIGKLLRFLSGYYSTWDPDLVEDLLRSFKLDPRKRTRALSRGQATRLRLITAMAFRPTLLILDEPMAGLDPAGQAGLIDQVLDVARDARRGVLISSHNLADVQRLCDRLLVLRDGWVAAEGTTDQVVGEHADLAAALRHLERVE